MIGRPEVGTGVQALPELSSSWPAYGAVAQCLDRDDVRYLSVTFGPARPPGLLEPIVRRGRLPHPDRVNEVLVNEAFAEVAGIILGKRLELKFLTQEEFFDFGQFGTPDGPLVDLTVVGLGRYPCPRAIPMGPSWPPRPSTTPTAIASVAEMPSSATSDPARPMCPSSSPRSIAWSGRTKRPLVGLTTSSPRLE